MYVNRNPFAREELHKEPVRGTCSWCGNSNRYAKVWKYRIEPDGILNRSFEITGQFCSIGCMKAYHS